MDQITEIVGQAGKEADFGSHRFSSIVASGIPPTDMALTLMAQCNIILRAACACGVVDWRHE
jgi:hypothetical protein